MSIGFSIGFRACVVVLPVTCLAPADAVRAASPMMVPSEDRRALDDLAPPSDPSTARGTYGDAAFARAGRKVRARDRARLALPRPCFGNRAGTPVMRCSASGSAFFRQVYVYTPSFVSAPQVLEPTLSGRTNLLSPVTSFFLNPFDPHDPPPDAR